MGTIETNGRTLGFLQADGEKLVADSAQIINSEIIPPCYIGENVSIKNSTVGPHVSIGDNSQLENVTLKNSLIQPHTTVKNANLEEAMIGNHAKFDGKFTKISIGDYSALEA